MPDLRPQYPTAEELWKNPILKAGMIIVVVCLIYKAILWLLH